MTQTATKALTMYIPGLLAEKLDLIVAKQGRSHSWIMQQALSAGIEHAAAREHLTREGLADVDADHVITHEAVQAWADSLSTEV
jgi:predicted transcriptional regulator